jgi:hypothetical protein
MPGQTLSKTLACGLELGLFESSGTGTKNDAFRYILVTQAVLEIAAPAAPQECAREPAPAAPPLPPAQEEAKTQAAAEPPQNASAGDDIGTAGNPGQ